jgi:hypothetical protein
VGVVRHIRPHAEASGDFTGLRLFDDNTRIREAPTAERLARGIDELHAYYKGRRGTLWRGVNEYGDRVFVRTPIDPDNTMKEVLGYRLSEAFKRAFVPLTVPAVSMESVFFDNGRSLGAGRITGTVQLEIPRSIDVTHSLGEDWARDMPADLTLFEALALAADPNRENHPASAADPVAFASRPKLAQLMSGEFPFLEARVMRVDWEQAFSLERFSRDPVARSVLTDEHLLTCLGRPEGAEFMRELNRKPSGWTDGLFDGVPVRREQRDAWTAAIDHGARHLRELDEKRNC